MDNNAGTRLNLSKLHYPVTVLGHGTRAGVWFQGCSIGCHGCISLDTWQVAAQHAVDPDSVLTWLRELTGVVDGVTISGGEPFDQPEALLHLLAGIRDIEHLDGADVLVYSGRSMEWLRDRFPDHLALADALISDPYLSHHDDDVPLRGSSNQRLTLLSDLGRARYERTDQPPDGGSLQIEVADGRIWMIGIPRRGDITRFEQSMRLKGVALGDVSWRP